VHEAPRWCNKIKLHQNSAALTVLNFPVKMRPVILGSFCRNLKDRIAKCPKLPAGMVSAIIPVSFVAMSRQPPFNLGDTHGNDSRRSLEDGKGQRSQIR
jgi:hypothetical protein